MVRARWYTSYMIEVVPTVVPRSLADVVATVERYQSFAHTIHVDVADGVFAPNTTWTPAEGEMLPQGMRYEIHLMVADPHEAGLQYAKAGAHSVIGHCEAFETVENARAAFEAWRAAGIDEVQTAALLQTPLATLSPFVPESDITLLMMIASIGVQGIPFEESGIARITELKAMHPGARIAVDGGTSDKNIERLAAAGATHFCAGSVIAKAPDPAAMYQKLIALAEAAL